MKYLKQFSIILAFSFAGEILHYFIPLPIPASIYGIILLFLCLEFKIISVKSIKETSNFLIKIMPVMFIPAAAGLIDTWGIMKDRVVVYIFVTVITTIIVMIAAGKMTQFLIKLQKKKRKIK